MRAMSRATLILLCAAALSITVVTQTGQSSATLYEGERLLTGDGTAPIDNAALLVENGRITGVGRKGEIALPRGGSRVDLSGKTVIPGLIDTHAHIGYMKDATNGPENYSRENVIDHMQRYAYFGVAAAQSMGSDFGDMPYQVRDSVAPNAARFVMAGRGLTYVGTGNPENTRQNAYMLSTPDEARVAVRELAARKIVLAKTWIPPVPPPIYSAIFDEAHRHNMRVWAHVTALPAVKASLEAGLDGLAHLPADLDDELLAMLKARPDTYISMTPTQGGRRNLYAPWLEVPTPASARDDFAGTDCPAQEEACRLSGRCPRAATRNVGEDQGNGPEAHGSRRQDRAWNRCRRASHRRSSIWLDGTHRNGKHGGRWDDAVTSYRGVYEAGGRESWARCRARHNCPWKER